MREIKFRAWDKEFGTMVYEFTKDGYSTDMQNGRLALGSNDGNGDYFELSLMQYTGLKDKNGKEIYEGDIIKSCDDSKNGLRFYYVVEWGHHAWTLRHYQATHKPTITSNYQFEKKEVIGNIYEQPELLKP